MTSSSRSLNIPENERPDFNFNEYIKNETPMSIIFILQTYQSLNLRQISKVLGISEPSTHAHITQLLERKIIELDAGMVGQRGKYYKLNKWVEVLIEEGEREFDENMEKKIDSSYYTTMAHVLRTVGIMNNRFSNYLANYMEERSEELAKDYYTKLNADNEETPQPLVSANLSVISVTSKEEQREIKDAFNEFTEKIYAINNRHKKLQPDETHEFILVSGLVLPLLRIDPRNQ